MNRPLATGLKVAGLAAVLLAGALTAPFADAHPRGRVGVWIGGPFWWPGYWGYPYVVERPVIVQPPAEPLIVQPSSAQQNQLWYYCRDAQMYYPYVTSCPSAWQEVPATPAPAPAAAPAPSANTLSTTSAPASPARTAPAPVPPAKAP